MDGLKTVGIKNCSHRRGSTDISYYPVPPRKDQGTGMRPQDQVVGLGEVNFTRQKPGGPKVTNIDYNIVGAFLYTFPSNVKCSLFGFSLVY